MPMYLLLDIGSILVPLIFSFHPKLAFHKEWNLYLPAILITMLLYILWDIWFTANGVWGFNSDYLIGINLFGLPLEEYLFFICIPYACLFTHHCLIKLGSSDSRNGKLESRFQVNSRIAIAIGLGLIMYWAISLAYFNDRTYTVVNHGWAIVLMMAVLKSHFHVLRRFLVTYVFLLVPFLIVNGILTGALYPEPIVWYDNQENMGLRLFMPIEDYTYAFTMLLLPLVLIEWLRNVSFLGKLDKKS